MSDVAAIALGAGAGLIAGMLGVGGGILFVPALLVLGLDQHDAEATSLLAIVPVALVGTWRQRGYGNVRDRDALLMGVLAAGGAFGGVALANAVSGHTLRVGFAIVMFVVAAQLVRRAASTDRAS